MQKVDFFIGHIPLYLHQIAEVDDKIETLNGESGGGATPPWQTLSLEINSRKSWQ